MKINIPVVLALLTALWFCFLFWKKRTPQMPSTPITLLPEAFKRPGIRGYIAHNLPYLFWASLACIAIALSDPQIRLSTQGGVKKETLPREGIAVYYLLDQSGSMAEKVRATIDDTTKVAPKIDLAKTALKKSLDERKDDLVGLIAFARVPRVLCPLTLDRTEILNQLNDIQPLQEDNVNGTAIGYAIFKAVNIFVATSYFADRQKERHLPVYQIKSRAIVIITDGLQEPNPADKENPFRFMSMDEAVNYAQENNIRVYFIGVDPLFKQKEFASDVAQMKNAIERSGGAFYIMTPAVSIDTLLSKINALEKSYLPPQTIFSNEEYETISLVPFFVGCALLFLAMALVSETLLARSVP